MSHSTTTHRRVHGPLDHDGSGRVLTLRTVADRRGGDRRQGDRRGAPRRAADRTLLRTATERWLAVAIFAGSTIVVAAVGAIVAQRGMTWYHRLERTPFVPPDAVFAPVWSSLYTINAIAGYLAWRSTRNPAPTIAWGVSLGLNLLWTLVFFGAHRPGLGLLVIVALWLSIVVFAIAAKPSDATATWLMLPYLSWVTFAGLLDLAIVSAN